MRPDLTDIQSAAASLRGLARRTPLVASRLLDEAAGQRVHLKAECLQRTGSFKIRGAATAIAGLSPAERAAGVVTHSSGNHGQAVALAARHSRVNAVVVMPEDASKLKVQAAEGYGATVVQAGVTASNRAEVAAGYVANGRRLIHPFDDWSVITGQGTVGLEIAEDAPEDIAVVLFPVGGGGLISGSVIALRELRPRIRVIGIEPKSCAAARASRDAGTRVVLPPGDTIADGARMSVGERPWSVITDLVDDLQTVSDAAIVEAVHFLATRLKLVVEPTGAMTVAALLSEPLRDGPVVAVLSGGNLDPSSFPWPRLAG